MSEGILPSHMALSYEQLEEERRVAYVAFTRSKEKLFLSDSEGINFNGFFRCPSRFIFDTEENNLDYLVPLSPELVKSTQNVVAIQEKYQQ